MFSKLARLNTSVCQSSIFMAIRCHYSAFFTANHFRHHCISAYLVSYFQFLLHCVSPRTDRNVRTGSNNNGKKMMWTDCDELKNSFRRDVDCLLSIGVLASIKRLWLLPMKLKNMRKSDNGDGDDSQHRRWAKRSRKPTDGHQQTW